MVHEHEHGPDCTCGCHDHEHAHEHEHHHEHEAVVELPWARVELEAHTHEQAATVSMNIHPKEESPVAFADLVNIMQEIARSSEQSGGIVGHIKAFAKRDNAFARVSVGQALSGACFLLLAGCMAQDLGQHMLLAQSAVSRMAGGIHAASPGIRACPAALGIRRDGLYRTAEHAAAYTAASPRYTRFR